MPHDHPPYSESTILSVQQQKTKDVSAILINDEKNQKKQAKVNHTTATNTIQSPLKLTEWSDDWKAYAKHIREQYRLS